MVADLPRPNSELGIRARTTMPKGESADTWSISTPYELPNRSPSSRPVPRKNHGATDTLVATYGRLGEPPLVPADVVHTCETGVDAAEIDPSTRPSKLRSLPTNAVEEIVGGQECKVAAEVAISRN